MRHYWYEWKTREYYPKSQFLWLFSPPWKKQMGIFLEDAFFLPMRMMSLLLAFNLTSLFIMLVLMAWRQVEVIVGREVLDFVGMYSCVSVPPKWSLISVYTILYLWFALFHTLMRKLVKPNQHYSLSLGECLFFSFNKSKERSKENICNVADLAFIVRFNHAYAINLYGTFSLCKLS